MYWGQKTAQVSILRKSVIPLSIFLPTAQKTAHLLLNSAAVTESNLKTQHEQAEFVWENPASLNAVYMKDLYYTMAFYLHGMCSYCGIRNPLTHSTYR